MSPRDIGTAGYRPSLSSAAVGLGLRGSLIQDLLQAPCGDFDFLECAPENWIRVGGRRGEQLRELSRRTPLVCHGLSLSLGSTMPLDLQLVDEIGAFMHTHDVRLYSEHLSFCSHEGHLYDLLPLPFTEEAVRHTAARIRRVQDRLGRRIAVENVSYYLAGQCEMDELTFTLAVLQEADCDLLLDVNNVFVNAHNHGYDAAGFIAAVPAARVAYLHVAGHADVAGGMKVDTHGSPVCGEVWSLLGHAFRCIGLRPTLLERDSNMPPYAVLREELACVRAAQQQTCTVAAHG